MDMFGIDCFQLLKLERAADVIASSTASPNRAVKVQADQVPLKNFSSEGNPLRIQIKIILNPNSSKFVVRINLGPCYRPTDEFQLKLLNMRISFN